MKEIYLGLDLCRTNVQISYFREDKQEPESFGQLQNTDGGQLPYTMFYSAGEQKWYVGDSVKLARSQSDGIFVENVMDDMEKDRSVWIGERETGFEELLVILLKTYIREFLLRSEEYQLAGLTVTLESYQEPVYRALSVLKKELELTGEQFHVISHADAFFQYVLRQEEKLRTNSIAMFEYGTDGMEYCRLDRLHQGRTEVFSLRRESLKEEIPYAMLLGDAGKLDRQFAELAREKLRETYFSTVYLTGQGFSEQWLKESTKVLCMGRRVFMGQNLYTRGACYHARFGAGERETGSVLVTPDSVPYDIGVAIGELEAANRFYPIAPGGHEWYNMKGKVTVFLDGTNRVHLVYRNLLSGETAKEIIEIHGLPKRPPKTTKISLEIEMFSRQMGAIVIRDVGFGKIYPTTNKIYRKEFSIGD